MGSTISGNRTARATADEVLRTIAATQPTTVAAVARASGRSHEAVMNAMVRLVRAGLVVNERGVLTVPEAF